MRQFTGILFCFYLLLVSSCTFDNKEDYFGELACVTTNLTYENEIKSIFDNNCVNCHNSVSINKPGIVLDNYDALKSSINSSRLWGSINHEDGFIPMPSNHQKLPQCTISKIGAWIENNMPEN